MLFRCAPRAPETEHGARVVARGPKGSRVVDIHCHRQSARATEMMRAAAEAAGQAGIAYGSELTREVNRKQMATIKPKMESVEVRLADMDRMGVDVQAVSSPPYQFYYWAEPGMAREAARLVNDDIAELVAGHPDRFVGLGTVPLQDTQLAVAELERCVHELGFRGIEINTNVDGAEISQARLDPFYAKVEELGALIFIHPAGTSNAERMKEHYFVNVIGHAVESALAVSHLIFDGVMERHPGLKICVAHGGGYLPPYAGRMDHAWRARADVREGVPGLPSDYLKRIHFDTMVFDPDQLRYLIEKFGADHVLLGTDYPYDMGEDDPLGLIAKVAGLSEDDAARIAGGNAARLLGLG